MKKYICQYKGMALLYLLMGSFNAFSGILITMSIQYITEVVVNKQTERQASMLWVVLGNFLILTATVSVYLFVKNNFVKKVMCSIRENVFEHIIRKDMEGFYKQNTSYYTSIFHNDLQVVETTLNAYFKFIQQSEEIIFSLIYACIQNIVIGVALFLIGIIGVFIPILSQRILEKSNKEYIGQAAKHNTVINDNFRGFEVKLFKVV